MKKPLVINLFGGPGISKSTTAAGVFSLLKLNHINVELVTEFAKDLTWENNKKTLENQYYIWAKQYHKLYRIEDKVDIIITDSPLLLSIIYSSENNINDDTFFNLVENKFKEFNNESFLLKRLKPYIPIGRNQTKEESVKIDSMIEHMLKSMCIDYTTIPGNFDGINIITNKILKKYYNNERSKIFIDVDLNMKQSI